MQVGFRQSRDSFHFHQRFLPHIKSNMSPSKQRKSCWRLLRALKLLPKKLFFNFGNSLARLPPELVTGILECARPASCLATLSAEFHDHCRSASSVQISWATACIMRTEPLPYNSFDLNRLPRSPGAPSLSRLYASLMATDTNSLEEHEIAVMRQAHVYQLPTVLNHVFSPRRWARLASTSPMALIGQWSEHTHALAPVVALLLRLHPLLVGRDGVGVGSGKDHV
ncbi:hypothetical protein BC828DRAFT_387830 [Blastocladiella britannica]|nr:hypothetical protein BC828DRAFT_387830 [Blastocladiella britannica]